MKGPLFRRFLAASGVLIVVVAVIYGVMLVAIGELRTSGREARHSQAVIAAADNMATLLLALESSARGFVITRQRVYLKMWRSHVDRASGRASALDRLLLTQVPERNEAKAIAAGVRSYIGDYSRPLVTTARRDPARAAAIVQAGEGRRRVEELRGQIGRLTTTETALAEEEVRQADTSGRRAVLLGLAGLLSTVLLIGAFAIYLARVVVLPVRRVAEAAKLLAAGDQSARASEQGVGAIRDLAIAFNGMIESLTDSQAELARFFTLSIEMLGVASMDGYFKRLNPAFERTLGYTSEELQAWPFVEFVHPEDRESTLAEVAKLASGITTISFENRYRCKDGSYVWLVWKAAPSVESGLLYAAAHDVTERKKAELEIAGLNRALEERALSLERQNVDLERLVDLNRALLDASVDGICLNDLEGRTLLANAALRELRAEVFDLEAGIGPGEQELIAGRLADSRAYLEAETAIASNPEMTTSDILEISDTRRAFHRRTGPVRNGAGELIGRIAVLRDVTAEREVARLKSELVATVSHELRTPLASVLGFAELLCYRDLDPETRRRYLEIIDGEAQRLKALIDDFLDLEKIEAGRFALALDPFDLADVVERQVELFCAQSAVHPIQFECADHPLSVIADANRVRQVVANLLSNAIKYSPGGGPVAVAASKCGGLVRVSVEDFGIGIPRSQQHHVFTRFFRVDSTDTREIGGTGLGLALCKDIVEAHAGRIGFETRDGEGSTFWFELPITPTG
jgi:PAS domain S-box-containing protein